MVLNSPRVQRAIKEKAEAEGGLSSSETDKRKKRSKAWGFTYEQR